MQEYPKHYCGVFGVYGHPNAAELTYYGLYALQHRGQESAGIVTSDGKLAVTGSQDQTVRVWDLSNGNAVRTLDVPGGFGGPVNATAPARLSAGTGWAAKLASFPPPGAGAPVAAIISMRVPSPRNIPSVARARARVAKKAT
jgi:hypothetical protein